MSSFEHHGLVPGATARRILCAAGLAAIMALGGCSADLGRFDFQGSGLSGDAPRASLPLPAEPIRRNAGAPMDDPPPAYAYNPAPLGTSASPDPVRLTGLPDPVVRDEPPSAPVGLPPRTETSRPVPRAPAPVATTGGIEVQSGDTLYGLARRHGVSISELMSVNGLQGPMIFPGQRLALPAGGRRTPQRRAVAAAPTDDRSIQRPTSAPARIAAAPPIAAEAPATADWTGTHTVTARDSLYAMSRRYGVSVAELKAVNGISDPRRIRAGTVLKVPGPKDTAGPAPTRVAAAPSAASATDAAAPAWTGAGSGIDRPTVLNARPSSGERVAVLTPAAPVAPSPASPAPATVAPEAPAAPDKVALTPGKFRWPAKGRIIAGFGPRSDSTHNDGINILVPQGTPVHAAEAGVVAYAGSELKGYGNLILIRHTGNWVSAYAHNEALLVKRGDKVDRGQPIAKAGRTGAVDQPQVHFELRKGSKPIDPLPHLEN